MTATLTITITGDRQSGKSQALVGMAITDATQGRDVLYETKLMAEADIAMKTCADLCDRLGIVYRARHVNGDKRLMFGCGGQARFTAASRRDDANVPDTHILDDVPGDGHPKACRVYKVLRH